jgi:hypothetical protein
MGALLLAITCSAVLGCHAVDNETDPPPPSGFDTVDEGMLGLIDPIVQGMEARLARDPGSVDYAAIQVDAGRAAQLFDDTVEPGHRLFLGAASSDLVHARQAAEFFRSIAAAAQRRDHRMLLELHAGHRTICTLCHAY